MNPVNPYTDTELITMLNQGDRRVFEIIYKTHVSDLYKYARAIINSREDCEEIIQEVFLKLWEIHLTIKVETIRPYLFTSVKHKMVDYIRYSKVKRKYGDHYKFFSAIYDSVEEQHQNAEAIYEIMEAGIQKLPDQLQKVIKLRLNENLSNKEIAERLNLSGRSVEKYVQLVNVRLRQAYKDFYNTS